MNLGNMKMPGLGRFDDITQDKVYDERDAVRTVLDLSAIFNYVIIGSPIITYELNMIKNDEKRKSVIEIYRDSIKERAVYTNNILNFVRIVLQQANLKNMDGFHLAFAEMTGADVLLTTDNKFLKACSRLKLKTKVINPLNFLEIQYDSNN